MVSFSVVDLFRFLVVVMIIVFFNVFLDIVLMNFKSVLFCMVKESNIFICLKK